MMCILRRPGSGHEIHLYQPDMVVQALERGVTAVRGRN